VKVFVRFKKIIIFENLQGFKKNENSPKPYKFFALNYIKKYRFVEF
jgi:hypothetical protein